MKIDLDLDSLLTITISGLISFSIAKFIAKEGNIFIGLLLIIIVIIILYSLKNRHYISGKLKRFS